MGTATWTSEWFNFDPFFLTLTQMSSIHDFELSNDQPQQIPSFP